MHTSPELQVSALEMSKTVYCHSLVLILILISIKTRIDNIFGQKHIAAAKLHIAAANLHIAAAKSHQELNIG